MSPAGLRLRWRPRLSLLFIFRHWTCLYFLMGKTHLFLSRRHHYSWVVALFQEDLIYPSRRFLYYVFLRSPLPLSCLYDPRRWPSYSHLVFPCGLQIKNTWNDSEFSSNRLFHLLCPISEAGIPSLRILATTRKSSQSPPFLFPWPFGHRFHLMLPSQLVTCSSLYLVLLALLFAHLD